MAIDLKQGDTFEQMKFIADQSVDLVCVDPPYGTTLCNWDSVLDWDLLWSEYERVLTPKGQVVLFASQPFTAAAVMSKPDWFRYELIWHKNKCGSPGLAKKRVMKVHENVLVFSKLTGCTYNPIMEKGDPYSRPAENGYQGKHNRHKYGFKGQKIENSGTRYPKSVVFAPRNFSAQQQEHPTQKPTTLLDWLLETYSNPGDTVLDNTMGSGSCGVSAVQTGRSFIGIERDPAFFDIAKKRIEAAEVGSCAEEVNTQYKR